MTKEEVRDRIADGLTSNLSTREIVLDILGGRCAECGFSKYKESLFVQHKVSPRGKSSSRYWLEVLRDLPDDSYSILCANCHFHQRTLNKTKPVEPSTSRQRDICIWRPDPSVISTAQLTTLTLPWADALEDKGTVVFVMAEPSVYQYKKVYGGARFVSSVEEFKKILDIKVFPSKGASIKCSAKYSDLIDLLGGNYGN